MNLDDILTKQISSQHFYDFVFPLIHLALIILQWKWPELHRLSWCFFYSCFSPSWPSWSLLDVLTPAIYSKTTVRQVCSVSSCQDFRINSLFSIPPTACHAGLCEISSREQWLLRMLLLLLLNLLEWLKRDWTKSAHAQRLPVLSTIILRY